MLSARTLFARGLLPLTADSTVRATPISSLFVLQQVVGELVFAAGVACSIRVVISDASSSRWPLLQLLELSLVAMVPFKIQNLASVVWCGNAQQHSSVQRAAAPFDLRGSSTIYLEAVLVRD